MAQVAGWTVVPEAAPGWTPVQEHAATHPEARISAAVPGTAIASTDPSIVSGAIGPKTRAFLDAPLVRPTGVDAIDNLSSPANLIPTALLGLAVSKAAAVPAANVVGRAKAAMSAVGSTVGTQIKYEITKSTLEALHVPAPIAIPVAMMVSGYKRTATAAPAQAPTVPADIGRLKAPGSSLELTQSMKPTGAALDAARAEAFADHLPAATPAVTPARVAGTAAPVPAPTTAAAPVSTPPGVASADPVAAMWRNLRAADIRPTESRTVARLLGQGVAPAEVEARILGARPSPPSVAPAELSPIQKAVNMKAGVEPSPSQVANGLGLAARKAQITLTAAEADLLKPLVRQGMAPEQALEHLPALKMQSIPGTMTDAQVAAEIAARKGNRSPRRDVSTQPEGMITPSQMPGISKDLLARKEAAVRSGNAGILDHEIMTEQGLQSVGTIVAEMQKAGTKQAVIDRWLQGLELTRRTTRD